MISENSLHEFSMIVLLTGAGRNSQYSHKRRTKKKKMITLPNQVSLIKIKNTIGSSSLIQFELAPGGCVLRQIPCTQ